MLNVAIVEDDKKYSDLLKGYICKYEKESGERFKVAVFTDGLKLLADYCGGGFNIIFMDIELPQMDGLMTSRKLRQYDANASIIFVTNMAKYAVNGYEVDALDFMVKPVDYFNFTLKFDKAVKIQKKIATSSVMIKGEDGMIKLKASDLLYVESSQHFVVYHTEKEDYKIRASMKDTEKKLEGMNFVRCNNSFLVNLAAVDKVTSDAVEVGGVSLPVSRSKKQRFLDALAVFYGGGL